MSEILVRAAQLLEAALALPPASRDAFVDEHCGADEALRQELTSLLAVAETADQWLGDLAQRVGDALTADPAMDGSQGARATLRAGERIGAWQIEGPLGAGGMGEVYLASRADGRYEQQVALKTLRGRLDPDAAKAFERERERLARLSHPGISRIIDAGETADGRPFMAMEHVEGERIDRWCQIETPDVTDRLRLLAELCAAVAHAHSRLLLHRDIKASNVLVDGNGNVRLIDFGISALVGDGESAQSGPLTVATAAPEQLAGQEISAQTDVFAIGLLAHQLLSGQLPARGADGSAVVDRTALGPRDLGAVIARATALAAEDRHPTADALAEDFLALIEHRPVSPLRADPLYRLGRTLRRFPVASAFAATATLAMVVGTAVSLRLADRAASEAMRANEALAEARFYLDRAELNAATQSAYAGALQRMFGEDADEARMRAILLAHAEDAYEKRQVDPDRAAEIAYAVGRHFVDRNDYAASLQVLEPWLEEGYGHPHLLRQGRLNQALAYRYTSRHDEASALFEHLVEAFTGTPDEGSTEHLLAIVQRAELIATPAQYSSALSLLERAVATPDSPQDEMFCWAYIEIFRRRLGEFSRAYAAARKAVEVFERNPLLELHGRVNTRSMLASYEIYHASDYASADQHIERALADAEIAGETAAIAELIYLRGELALFQGHLAQAEELFRRSRAMELEYFPVDIGGTASLAETLAEGGEFTEAERELTALTQRLGELQPGRPPHPRVTIAKAHLAALRDGVGAASDTLARAGFTRQIAAGSVVGSARVRRLEAMGVSVLD